MKTTLSNFIIFATGAAIGSVVTWKILKTRYEQIAQEEIDSVKEVFSKKEDDLKWEYSGEPIGKIVSVEKTEDGVKLSATVNKPDLQEYAAKIKEEGYFNYSNPSEPKKEDETKVEKPYVIPSEEFGEADGYDTISLTYYIDGYLADDDDEIVEDIDDVIGLESLNHFGDYEDDSVFVRNDRLMTDYEILLDQRNYLDIINKSPHLVEEE